MDKYFQEKLKQWQKEAEKKVEEIESKPTNYWLSRVDPTTGKPYKIPLLTPGMEGYEREYVELMKLKELNPELFAKIMNWD